MSWETRQIKLWFRGRLQKPGGVEIEQLSVAAGKQNPSQAKRQAFGLGQGVCHGQAAENYPLRRR